MTVNPTPPRVVRFADFRANLRAGELYKHRTRIRIPEQSFQILVVLLEIPGDLVTREQLRSRLWSSDNFGDFDHGLNNAVSRLREALCDSAEKPRFIETLPRRGYRFIAPVTRDGLPEAHPITETAQPKRRSRRRAALGFSLGLGVPAAILAVLLAFNFGGVRGQLLTGTRRPEIHSIAVLPLENLTGDPSQDYFTDGMTDALITDLAQIRSLRVISRTSSIEYKHTGKSLPQIGRELNVDAVVEGTVTSSGNKVRIDAQLIRAKTDQHLWARSFERNSHDILALQDDVSAAVAGEIRAKINSAQAQSASARSVNPGAYQYYLEGRYNFSERLSKEGYDNAVRYFEMAIEKDPHYAPAYAGLAHCYATGSFQGQELPARQAWSKAAAAAAKALELDDQLAEAHFAMAEVHFRFDWNWQDAEREYKRGLELSPNDADGHSRYAIFLALMGRFDEAIAEATRARDLDPLSPEVSTDLAWVYEWSRQWPQAIAESQRALRLDPNFILAHSCLARSYEGEGRNAESVKEQLKLDALRGDTSKEMKSLRDALTASGLKGFWARSLELEKQVNPPRYFAIGRLCVHLGRTDEAFYWLERAYEARYQNMPNMKIGAQWLDALRSDPRYADLMRRVGLPL